MTWYDARHWRAPRLIYTLLVGPIPEGLTIDHVKARGCTSTACVNPDHLEPVTLQENIRRGLPNRRKTHCKAGHEFTPESTVVQRDGRRRCRICKVARTRAWRRKQKR